MMCDEAIYELKHTVGNINYDQDRGEIYFTDKWVQAYEMAMSALQEQEELQERLNENIGAAKMWRRRYYELVAGKLDVTYEHLCELVKAEQDKRGNQH